ncbi:MAG: VIT1/CCC1 transporter family protein [Brucellaceae bacterium]|nr:VIT1/CCC1 transporter family protein [Brucellaceae bacterium]
MELEHSHRKDAIRERLAQGAKPNYLRDWIYGGIDGAVTTMAVVAGVAGAALSWRIVMILGLANLLADGLSMAASNYSGTKSEIDDLKRYRAIEKRHIELEPQGEREEVRQIMAAKGLSGETLEHAVDAITSNEEAWIGTMITDEYGLTENLRDPLKSALATFVAFVLCGTVPLLPYVFLEQHVAFTVAAAMTLVVFFSIGSMKSIWSLAEWWRSGLETLAIGAAAAGIAYAIGYVLRDWAA